MSASEERDKLMDSAAELVTLLRKITEPVNKVVNALIGEADALLPDAATEKEEARGIVTRKLTTKKLHDKAQRTVAEKTVNDNGDEVTVKHRKCSKCGVAGHTARTCGRKK